MSFAEMGLCPELLAAVSELGWAAPTAIQTETIPVAMQNQDLIALAETGSGKTGAFALPILHRLLSGEPKLKALVLSPTRELARQIYKVFDQFCDLLPAAGPGRRRVECALITGGTELMDEAIALATGPEIIIATPGRMVEHLEKNTSFRGLNQVTVFVLDEADMMLSLDFQPQIEAILKVLHRERTTWLFSATMTSKVSKLSRSSVKPSAVRVSVSDKYSEVKNLDSRMMLVPDRCKDLYLAHLLSSQPDNTLVICFTETCQQAERLKLFCERLNLTGSLALHGHMDAAGRVDALAEFAKPRTMPTVLFATDVASRGLDIPAVELVINYDLPKTSKEYIHRVGRTARASRSGRAVTFVTKQDLGAYLEIERNLHNKLQVFPVDHSEVVAQLQAKTIAASKSTSDKLREDATLRKRHRKTKA